MKFKSVVMKEPEISVTLTVEELQFIHDICYYTVGGDMVDSRRRIADQLYESISDDPRLKKYIESLEKDFSGSIQFLNTKKSKSKGR